MNKKALFLILSLSILIIPITVFAEDVTGISGIVTNITNLVMVIGGGIVVIGWVIAGILYLTAAGAPEKTGTAKKAMIAAVIGTVLVILATTAGTITSLVSSAIFSGI
jgi:hypothetical protein